MIPHLPRPRSAGRFLVPILLAATLVVFSGCHLPTPDTRFVLHIAATGAITLDGVPVAAGGLNEALAARQVAGTHLMVQILASPQADIRLVEQAVEASRRVHASVAFAGDVTQ